jgi:hypothetical protein
MPQSPYEGYLRSARIRLTDMEYELWDAELGVSLGSYSDEASALAAVQRLCADSNGSRAPLGLLQWNGQARIVATGDELVQRALSRA